MGRKPKRDSRADKLLIKTRSNNAMFTENNNIPNWINKWFMVFVDSLQYMPLLSRRKLFAQAPRPVSMIKDKDMKMSKAHSERCWYRINIWRIILRGNICSYFYSSLTFLFLCYRSWPRSSCNCFYHLLSSAGADACCQKPGRASNRYHHRLQGVRFQFSHSVPNWRE